MKLYFHLFTALVASISTLAQETDPTAPLPAAKPEPRTAVELARQTAILYNENDIDSVALAGFYQEKRGIPPENLIAVKCPPGEEIARDDYDRTIAEPVRKIFIERGWWKIKKEKDPGGNVLETKIRFLAVIRGIPLKIKQTGFYTGDSTEGDPEEIFQRNECALDSDLAVLGLWSRRISGILNNPYFRDTKTIQQTELYSQLLVSRLDAPTPAIVRRMIEDAIAVEKTGLHGFAYVDARGLAKGPLLEGDQWMHKAATDLRENGIPVILDNGPALFPAPYPMSNPAIYLGWYSENTSGPFASKAFQFLRGAVAVHLHSFSASTLRSSERGWCGPLLTAGATATIGNVYEPYLGLTSHLHVFSQRLREGFTFAEAGAMSQRFLSWMTTCIGDPLYRPFLAQTQGKNDLGNEWNAYRAGVQTWIKKNRNTGIKELETSAKQLKSGLIYEGLGLLHLAGNNPSSAIPSFESARSLYKKPADKIRTAIHESGAIRAAKGATAMRAFLKEQITQNPSADATEILRLLNTPEPPEKGN